MLLHQAISNLLDGVNAGRHLIKGCAEQAVDNGIHVVQTDTGTNTCNKTHERAFHDASGYAYNNKKASGNLPPLPLLKSTIAVQTDSKESAVAVPPVVAVPAKAS